MKIGMIQLDGAAGDVERNVNRAFSLLEEAAGRAELLVLPELWTIGYNFHDLSAHAVRPGDGLLEKLSSFARFHQIYLAAGTLPVQKEGRIYNTGFLFGKQGEILGTYSKRHLFGGYLEGDLMTPGTDLMEAQMGENQCGMGICYELYFPDMYREMAKRGTTFVFVPASWPLVHISKWEVLARARAIENGMYICAVNMAGSYHGVTLGGHSLFINPEGKILARCGTSEEIQYADYDLAAYPDLGKQLAVIRSVRSPAEG